MKNVIKKITCLVLPLLAIGCAQSQISETPFNKSSSRSQQKTSSTQKSTSKSNSQNSSSNKSSSKSSSKSSQKSSSSLPHVHNWSTEWSFDETNHWHTCKDKTCTEVNDTAPHVMGELADIDPAILKGADQYAYSNPKAKKCTTCDYYTDLTGTNILPELRFTFSAADPNADFATKATKKDLYRPEVSGTISITNCDSQYQLTNLAATMKVRGNQTAGWAKKGFRIKFDKKQTVFGLNGGKKFKKWVLLADAKDTCLVRTAMGLYVSKAICKDGDNVWVSDYTPVTVYLNDEYWGLYYLAEQKEVNNEKDKTTGEQTIGRVNLLEPADGYQGVDIGYCFELDHYADAAGSRDEASEIAKGADGDPTFRIKYSPNLEQGRPTGYLATGQVNTYTMLSDITDGPRDDKGDPTEHLQADYTNLNGGQLTNNSTKTSNSAQLSFIRDRMEALYRVLYEAAINKRAKEINDNNEVVDTEKTVEEVIAQYFDLTAWVDGYIINAFSCPPDLGYSSFYMSYDNSPTGDKKLRYDVPWDFDSNFGNRNNFYVNAQGDTYVDNTYNTWLYLLSKLTFFVNMVKTKWNQIREELVFENMFHMLREHFANNDAEIHRNHYKWPQNDAAHQPPNNFDEIRDPYKEPSQYLDAEVETISWCAKRVNFLETKWGTGRPNVNTNA